MSERFPRDTNWNNTSPSLQGTYPSKSIPTKLSLAGPDWALMGDHMHASALTVQAAAAERSLQSGSNTQQVFG